MVSKCALQKHTLAIFNKEYKSDGLPERPKVTVDF